MNPEFEVTYAIRGNVYESLGNLVSAAEQYRHALQIDPYNQGVRQALDRVQQKITNGANRR
jgi:Tfp pilus assembly protein PilF